MIKLLVLISCLSSAFSQLFDEPSDAQSYGQAILSIVEADVLQDPSFLEYVNATEEHLNDNINVFVDSLNLLASKAEASCKSGDFEVATITKVYANLQDVFFGNAAYYIETDDFDSFVQGLQKPTKKVALSKRIMENDEIDINSDITEDVDYILSLWEAPLSTDECKIFMNGINKDVTSATESLRIAQTLSGTSPNFLDPLNDAVVNRVVMVQYLTDLLTNNDTTKAVSFIQIAKNAAGLQSD